MYAFSNLNNHIHPHSITIYQNQILIEKGDEYGCVIFASTYLFIWKILEIRHYYFKALKPDYFAVCINRLQRYFTWVHIKCSATL